MKHFLGIDGGGTRTRALLSDECGRIVARAHAGLSNPGHASDTELLDTFGELFKSLGQHRVDACVSAFAGIAGVTCESSANRLRNLMIQAGLNNATVAIDHDIRIALAGGLGGSPGIALIVGTGSSCYGRDVQGRTCQTGGWGSLVADEGSGHFLGHEAMIAAVRMADGRLPRTNLQEAVFKLLGITNISQILKRLYEDEISRTEIAAFAPAVLDLAEHGDSAALEILDRGADELAKMVAANHRQLPTGPHPDVAITGGLGTANSIYRDKLCRAITRMIPTVRIHDLVMLPEAGAVMLAMQEMQGPVSAEIIENLRTTSA